MGSGADLEYRELKELGGYRLGRREIRLSRWTKYKSAHLYGKLLMFAQGYSQKTPYPTLPIDPINYQARDLKRQ